MEHLTNKDVVLKLIEERNFVPGSRILRLPLPLKSYLGEIVSTTEFDAVKTIVDKLIALKAAAGELDHRAEVYSLLAGAILPIELAHANSLVLIARLEEPYSFLLS